MIKIYYDNIKFLSCFQRAFVSGAMIKCPCIIQRCFSYCTWPTLNYSKRYVDTMTFTHDFCNQASYLTKIHRKIPL